MEIDEIINKIQKPATRFLTGGFRPTNSIEESWIGKVSVFGKDEDIPFDEKGNKMLPLFQVFLLNLPFVPEILKDIKLITVFMSSKFPEVFEPMGKNWVLREYESLEDIEIREIDAFNPFIKPFPLKPELFENDFPIWDDKELNLRKEILELEKKGVIEDYYDFADHAYEHKIGGYPSFCQSGILFSEDFEFVFQVSSDEKAKLNVIDNGSFMFARNRFANEWEIYYDFY